MPVYVDVAPRPMPEPTPPSITPIGPTVEEIAEGVRQGVSAALSDMIFALTLADDERAALDRYRIQKEIDRRGAHQVIKDKLTRPCVTEDPPPGHLESLMRDDL